MMNDEYQNNYDDSDDAEMELLGKQYHHQVEGVLCIFKHTLQYQPHEEIEKIEWAQDFMASVSTISGGQYIWKFCLNIWKAKKKKPKIGRTNMSMGGSRMKCRHLTSK